MNLSSIRIFKEGKKLLNNHISHIWKTKKKAVLLSFFGLFLVLSYYLSRLPLTSEIISPLTSSFTDNLEPLEKGKGGYEVFGFAPHWRFSKLDNVDFSVLTTLAYFSVEIDSDGSVITDDAGYKMFTSDAATQLFSRAHESNTRVVLTITQMDNEKIEAILDDPAAQQRAIDETVSLVDRRGIDGINIDFEHSKTPPFEYRAKFANFVQNMTTAMHEVNPASRVTVSVYASAAKYTKLYDIGAISDASDGIFMMAYDFSVKGSDHAMPTAPLYGHKEGKYWYDISTAVDDFLVHMPAEKLILGVPYYGYNYPVKTPAVKAANVANRWRGYAETNIYSYAQNEITATMADATDYKEGWDEYGRVSWRAYYLPEYGTWRMVFMEDARSLGEKYDFAISKNLGGVGMWALGFDNGRTELWDLLGQKFGRRLAKSPTVSVVKKI